MRVDGHQGVLNLCSDGWGVAPDIAAPEQAPESHNMKQGERGAMSAMRAMYSAVGIVAGRGGHTQVAQFECRIQATLEICRKVAGWGN